MSEVWQVQIHDEDGPLDFLRQGSGDPGAALQEAAEWRRLREGDENLTIFFTLDPAKFLNVDRR